MRSLIAPVEGEVMTTGVPIGDAAARLQRDVGLPVLIEPCRDQALRAGKGAGDTADVRFLVRNMVARHGRIHRRGADGTGGLHAGDGRQRRIFDRNRLGGSDRVRRAVRDHGSDQIAGKAYAIDRKRGQIDRLEALDRRRDLQRGGAARKLRAGPDGDSTRHRERGRRIDANDAGVRVRAAHEYDVQRARYLDVADVAAFPGEETLVLGSQQRLADHGEVAHGVPSDCPVAWSKTWRRSGSTPNSIRSPAASRVALGTRTTISPALVATLTCCSDPSGETSATRSRMVAPP